ncbi:MAG: Gfo/Idh/MocA family oxidoreductase [Prolixibacteraceae bacterium]|jgi:predicted dehydrogenase|nr:Gfo/Idh/MocA family oxidoreductase [Prolixibacteraceae bacterium]
MDEIKWGIIGCGDVTEVKSGPAFNKVAHSQLVAVMRRDKAKAADYARRHSVKKWTTDAQNLINDPEVNAVYVATPPSSHAQYAKMAIEAGKPVYIEKPMCRTYKECAELNELARIKNVPVFVAYYRRALPGFLKVKELIEKGAIGTVRNVNIQLYKHAEEQVMESLPWRVDPEIAGGGHFYDLAAHQTDYLHFLFGDFHSVKSIVSNQAGLYSAEDMLAVSFLIGNGIVGSGTWCFSSSDVNDRDVIEIVGTKGRIEFSCFDFVPVKLVTTTGIEAFDFPKPEHVQQNLIQNVVKALRGEETPLSDGQSGAVTNKVMEEIVRDYYKKPIKTKK